MRNFLRLRARSWFAWDTRPRMPSNKPSAFAAYIASSSDCRSIFSYRSAMLFAKLVIRFTNSSSLSPSGDSVSERKSSAIGASHSAATCGISRRNDSARSFALAHFAFFPASPCVRPQWVRLDLLRQRSGQHWGLGFPAARSCEARTGRRPSPEWAPRAGHGHTGG